jgi:hypothetical protein
MKRLWKYAVGVALIAVVALAVALPAAGAKTTKSHKSGKCFPTTMSSKAWSFGVMDDTQWTVADPAGTNPNSVSKSIIDQIDPQFIGAGVKFVIQVGDLTDNGGSPGIATRAAAAQPLLNAGIGFFPMRGNHETYAGTSEYGGTFNNFAIPAFQAAFPQTRGLNSTFGAKNFSSPTSVSSDLNGMSYSFDYGTPGNNARFVIIDNWATPSKDVSAAGYDYGYSIADQQNWISSRLNENTRGTTQAFVFSHQPLIAENHQDSPFTGYTYANPDMQNAFLASLQNNDVKYYICGHDHINQRSIIKSPDGKSQVQEIIGASDSSKFYTPKSVTDAGWVDPVTKVNQKTRETSVTQDPYRVGYYIYTVDGPRVTVDYYADKSGSYPNGFPGNTCPTFNFVKVATWGYSLNGKEFVIGGGTTNGTNNSASYAAVQDSFQGTSAKILSGTYDNAVTDLSGRTVAQAVDTGWSCDTRWDGLNSNILTLWGMAPVGKTMTDTYTLSMSSDTGYGWHHGFAGFGVLAAKNASGQWVKAVDLNTGGGVARFVIGPYQPQDTLNTYGFDPSTHTAWAVINYTGSFAVDGGLDLVWNN